MATDKQKELFSSLLSKKEFPGGTDKEALKAQFANVPDKSASAWIEKAIALPDAGDVPPPF